MKLSQGNLGLSLLLGGLILASPGCKGNNADQTADTNSGGTTGGTMAQNPSGTAGSNTAGGNAAATAGNAMSGASNAVSDAGVTAKVKNAINLSKLIDHKKSKINVDTKPGEVVLRGTVAAAKEKTEAERLAKENAGGRKVVDQLTVGAKG
jgi:osmotically-inducible protein OsmY